MTPRDQIKELQQQIQVLNDYIDGAPIEWIWKIRKSSDTWAPITNGQFNFADKIYRKAEI